MSDAADQAKELAREIQKSSKRGPSAASRLAIVEPKLETFGEVLDKTLDGIKIIKSDLDQVKDGLSIQDSTLRAMDDRINWVKTDLNQMATQTQLEDLTIRVQSLEDRPQFDPDAFNKRFNRVESTISAGAAVVMGLVLITCYLTYKPDPQVNHKVIAPPTPTVSPTISPARKSQKF